MYFQEAIQEEKVLYVRKVSERNWGLEQASTWYRDTRRNHWRSWKNSCKHTCP